MRLFYVYACVGEPFADAQGLNSGAWTSGSNGDLSLPAHSRSGRPRRLLRRNLQYLESAGHFLSARPVFPGKKKKIEL